jgi:hypothetical protein
MTRCSLAILFGLSETDISDIADRQQKVNSRLDQIAKAGSGRIDGSS